jgi:hypothetical protein
MSNATRLVITTSDGTKFENFGTKTANNAIVNEILDTSREYLDVVSDGGVRTLIRKQNICTVHLSCVGDA